MRGIYALRGTQTVSASSPRASMIISDVFNDKECKTQAERACPTSPLSLL